MALPTILPIAPLTSYADIWALIDSNFGKSVESLEIPTVGVDANKIKLKLFDGTYIISPVIPFPTLSAINGVNLNGTAIEMGGDLTKNTVINAKTFSFLIQNGVGAQRIRLTNLYTELAGALELRIAPPSIDASTASVGDLLQVVDDNTGECDYGIIKGTHFTSLSIIDNKVRLTFKDATYLETAALLTTVNTAVNYGVTGTNNQLITTTVRPLIITLPATPQNAQTITVKAITASGGSPITINGNGKNIDGAATATLTSNYASRTLIFNTALNIWLNV
jgi:hypothetical protein